MRKSVYRSVAATLLAACAASANAGIAYEWTGVCVSRRMGDGMPLVPCSETITGRLELPDSYVLGTTITSLDPVDGQAPLLSYKDAFIDMQEEDLYDDWMFKSSADGSSFEWGWNASASRAFGSQYGISLYWETYWVDASFTSLRMIPQPATIYLVGVAMLALVASGRNRKHALRWNPTPVHAVLPKAVE